MIQVGFIGCGQISKKHMQSIGKLSELELVAVSDLNHEKMIEVTEQYRKMTGIDQQIAMYEDYKNLILDPRIDLIIIATISSLHAPMAKQALKHQKHVIVEKPFALSLQDAREMTGLAEKYNKHLFVCHQLRYRSVLKNIKQLIEDQVLGDLYYGVISLRLNRSNDYYRASSWRGTWTKDGGMLVNQGIHLVDLLIWFLGDAEAIYGEIMTPLFEKETEDIAFGIVAFNDGIKGLIEANTITKPENVGYYLSLFGEKGTIVIGGKGFDEIDHCFIEGHPELEQQLQEIAFDCDEHELMYKDFIQAIQNRGSSLHTENDGQKALEVIFSLYESARKNKLIHLPLTQFSTEQMIESQDGNSLKKCDRNLK